MPALGTIPLPFNLAKLGYIRSKQAFGGDTSHQGHLHNSVDFSVPFGTPVLSLGRGTVVDLREDVKDGGPSAGKGTPSAGPSNMGNFVTVHYPELGIYATYAHLMYGSVVPSREQTVTPEMVLGMVGNTGWRDATHLHFQIGTEKIQFATGWVANGATGSAPFDTATGAIAIGMVSAVTLDLASSGEGLTNLTLVGAANINGFGDQRSNILSGTRGNNTLDGRDGNDTLYGGEGKDTLRGGHGNDRLFGGDHNDYLFGNEENDILYGDGGDDRLEGGAGNDTLFGGSGRDTLVGGSSKDEMTGGAGADVFVYNSKGETTVGTSRDVIRDFRHKDGDKIDLSNIDANENKSKDQAFSFIGSKAFTGKAGELALHGNILEGDVNGDGKADFQIQLDGVTSLQSSDFIF